MAKDRSRSIKTKQLMMRSLLVICTGNTGVPVLSGPDSSSMTVTDLGVGNYRLNITNPFLLAAVVSGIASISDDTHVRVTATAVGSVTVQCVTLANVAAEGDFSIQIQGTDHRFYY